MTLTAPAVPLGAMQGHALTGTVTDVTGGVIIGAVVTLEGAPDGPRTVQTSARGEFAFRSLPAGTYLMLVVAPGFAKFQQAVELPARRSPLHVTLQVEITDRVDVSVLTADLGSAGVLSTATLSGAALAALPDDPYSMLRRLQEMAGATGDAAQVVVTVDGFRQSVRLPPKEAIQMIRISTNPFAPEFAELAQARIDVVTKPGSSTVHAEVRASFNDGVMNARNPLAPVRADEQMRQLSGYLSGPVIPDRWSYVVYAGSWQFDYSQVVNASGIDPATGSVIAQPETMLTPSRLTNVWLGNDVRLSPLHTLSVSAGFTSDRADNKGLESGIDMPQRGYRSDADLGELRMSMTSVVSGRTLNELRGLISRRRTTTLANDATPAVLVLNAFNGGGNQSFLFNQASLDGVQLIEHMTTTLGRHTLKLGVDFDGAQHRHIDRADFGGTFLFGADFARDGSGAPLVNAAGERIPISPLDSYQRTLQHLPGHGPSQFSITRGNPDVSLLQWWSGWFAQDDWAVHPRFTVSYGLRQEWQSELAGGDLAGRAGVAWAIDSGRRNLVRAGAGKFYGRIEPALALDVLRSSGDRLEHLLIERPGFFPTVPPDLTGGQEALPTVYVRAAELGAPETMRVAVAFERQLPKNGFLTFGYDHQDGRNLLRTIQTNAPGPDGARPDPTRGMVLQYESTGRLRRHQLSTGFRFQPSPWVSGFATYSYIYGRSDTDGRSTAPADARRLDAEFGYTMADLPHQGSAGAWISLPWGLSVSPFVTIASGRAFNITTGYDNNGDGLFLDRPSEGVAGSASVIETPYGAFDIEPGLDDPIILRNAGREPLQIRLDVNATSMWQIGGRTLHVSFDVQNVFNRSIFAGYNGVLTSPTFNGPNLALYPRRAFISCGFSF
jgi:hypothetical protein